MFKEFLLECYLPGGKGSYNNILLKVNTLRGVNIISVIIFIMMVRSQFIEDVWGDVAIFCDIMGFAALLLLFKYSEGLYKNEGLSSRPMIVYSNGLMIPPIYLRALSKEKGFIHKDLIDHIEVRWHKEHTAYFSKVSSIVWYDAPVEFIVHLKNGKAISSGKRPPETILGAVETMEKVWGIKVNRQGFKNGRMERIVDLETVEEREL